MLVLSPRAVERLEREPAPRPLPKIFRLTKGGKLIEDGAMAFLRREYMVLVPFVLVAGPGEVSPGHAVGDAFARLGRARRAAIAGRTPSTSLEKLATAALPSGHISSELVELLAVSPNYFSLLGASARLGRVFGPQDYAVVGRKA